VVLHKVFTSFIALFTLVRYDKLREQIGELKIRPSYGLSGWGMEYVSGKLNLGHKKI